MVHYVYLQNESILKAGARITAIRKDKRIPGAVCQSMTVIGPDVDRPRTEAYYHAWRNVVLSRADDFLVRG
jgi:hypothetical protein